MIPEGATVVPQGGAGSRAGPRAEPEAEAEASVSSGEFDLQVCVACLCCRCVLQVCRANWHVQLLCAVFLPP